MKNFEWIDGGGVVSARGFIADAARGGIKTQGPDVAIIAARETVPIGAVFTRNMVRAAAVQVCIEHAAQNRARGIVFNSGNANCCTGAQGLQNAREMCELAAQKIRCAPEEVLVCSTGIIGHQLPMEKVRDAIGQIELSDAQDVNENIARAAMTTDTRPKSCAARAEIGGEMVTVGGQVKGVGMIGPNMGAAPSSSATLHATLLSFVTTDALIESVLLQRAVEHVAERTFNSVTVDGDTSTNDTFIVMASGQSSARIEDDADSTATTFNAFCALLEAVCTRLAKMVAADGEGATKIITIEVSGAATESDARCVAMTIANSPLVKTAIFGNDPNWGRLAMAAGRAGVDFDAQHLGLKLNETEVFRNGEPTEFDAAQASAQLQNDEVRVQVLLSEGAANWTAWTCDFSYEYVKINAEYHT